MSTGLAIIVRPGAPQDGRAVTVDSALMQRALGDGEATAPRAQRE